MLNQNPRHADFVLGTCPSCEKVLRIPVTAVTSQSKSHVRCPICDNEFELADVLEEMIPAVEIIDANKPKSETPNPSLPDRINAIDTPELFHVAKYNYEPITKKKNGRYVVPKLLSKGIDKKKKKRSRRRSRSKQGGDPRLAESLAKLKENTSATNSQGSDQAAKTRQEKSSDRTKKSTKSGSRKSTIKRIPTPSITRIRSFSDFKDFLKACKSLLISKKRFVKSETEKHSSRVEYMMIGLGALLAIPVLHLMMWWFVGIDPLGLAKPTSYVVPFVVPNELQAEVSDSTGNTPVEPSKQTFVDSENFQEAPISRSPDGKLPKPKLDPSSVHVDDY